MTKVWLELKYGEGKAAVTVCRLTDAQILHAFKRKVIQQAQWSAQESLAIDPVVGMLDDYEMRKLKAVLEMLIPSGKSP